MTLNRFLAGAHVNEMKMRAGNIFLLLSVI